MIGRLCSFVFPPPIVLPGVGGFAGVGVFESRRGLASSHIGPMGGRYE